MKNWYLVVIAAVVILLGAVFLFSKNDAKVETTEPLKENTNTAPSEASKSSMKKTFSEPPQTLNKNEIEGKIAKIKTKYGDIDIKISSEAPLTASNFIFLINEGFYDGLTFHRREEGFVIQGGDPVGNGTGGPGYRFKDEPVKRDYKRGVVAMANAGPNTNGSQFFIMLSDYALPKQYTIFGDVVTGLDVVDKIKVGDVMEKVTIEDSNI